MFPVRPQILGQYRTVGGQDKVALGAAFDLADGAGACGWAEAGADGIDNTHAKRGRQWDFVIVADDDQLAGLDIGGGQVGRGFGRSVAVVPVAAGDNGLKCSTGGGGGCVAGGCAGGTGDGGGIQWVGRRLGGRTEGFVDIIPGSFGGLAWEARSGCGDGQGDWGDSGGGGNDHEWNDGGWCCGTGAHGGGRDGGLSR